MPKVSGELPSLANGVSQQAPALRLPSQGEVQENCFSTILKGLTKRPPTNLRADLGALNTSATRTHFIERDADEKYIVLIASSGVRVFDLDGAEKTVNATTSATRYLQSGVTAGTVDPYRAITVGDFTFIVNRAVVVQLSEASRSPQRTNSAFANVAAGNYARTYSLSVGDSEASSYETPLGGEPTFAPRVATTYIARELSNNFDHAGHPGFTVTVIKNVVRLARGDDVPFLLSGDDGQSGTAMKIIQGVVQDFSDLPSFCKEGEIVQVTGSPANNFDDYYVRYEPTRENETLTRGGPPAPSTGKSPGVWKEIPAPGILTAFDEETMPVVLVREADGTFTLRTSTWDTRKAGNDETCPAPSFVGKRIENICFYKNRLGVLSEENIILSKAGDYFDFWRSTATALLDDDPVDVAAAEPGVSFLRSAISHEGNLLLFSDERQFVFRGNELLTPKTASIRATTSYASSALCAPVQAADAVFFAGTRGSHAMVREYTVTSDGLTSEAEDVTAHVPQYIPGNILRLAASTYDNLLVARTDNEANSLYVYRYFWSDNEKLQSSWSRWSFPGIAEIIDIGFVRSRLILLCRRDDGRVYIEDMSVEPGQVDPGAQLVVHLDRRELLPTSGRTYDAAEDQTTIPVPSRITPGTQLVTSSTNGEPGVALLGAAFPGGGTITVPGDLRGRGVYAGLPYESRYRVSPVYIRREGRGGGSQAVTTGRLQLHHIAVQYTRTAYFRVEITPLGRQTRSYTGPGRLEGDPRNLTDEVYLRDGAFRVPVMSRNIWTTIDIVNDSPLPSAILGVSWGGTYADRGTL